MSGPGSDATPTGPPVTGPDLAGGRSRRLGRDKRLVTVAGETLLTRTVRVLADVADDVTVVVADPADRDLVTATIGPVPAAPRLRTAVDVVADAGPVAGLAAALTAASHPWVLVVATDHPRLPVEVLALLADVARGAGDRAAGALEGPLGPEPLLAAYRRDAGADVARRLAAGTRRLVDVLAALDPVVVPRAAWAGSDPGGVTLHDVDEPGDLAEQDGGSAPS